MAWATDKPNHKNFSSPKLSQAAENRGFSLFRNSPDFHVCDLVMTENCVRSKGLNFDAEI